MGEGRLLLAGEGQQREKQPPPSSACSPATGHHKSQGPNLSQAAFSQCLDILNPNTERRCYLISFKAQALLTDVDLQGNVGGTGSHHVSCWVTTLAWSEAIGQKTLQPNRWAQHGSVHKRTAEEDLAQGGCPPPKARVCPLSARWPHGPQASSWTSASPICRVSLSPSSSVSGTEPSSSSSASGTGLWATSSGTFCASSVPSESRALRLACQLSLP